MLAVRSIDNLFDQTRRYPQDVLIMGHHAYDKAQVELLSRCCCSRAAAALAFLLMLLLLCYFHAVTSMLLLGCLLLP